MSKPALTWIEETRDLGAGGRRVERRATAEERQAVAVALGLLACDALGFTYVVKPRAHGRWWLEGTLSADVVQACVVSLEPVAARIEEAVGIELWPPELIDERADGSGDRAILGADDPEPLDRLGRIETGRLAFEILSAGLDPYPRKPGTEFDWSEGESEPPQGDSPFAALKALKLREGEK